jgi:pimeloyl-ACP methyl ester carboxylesterase
MLADLEPIMGQHPDWQRFYLDLPGHGNTPAPGWLSTQDQMLSIVLEFIDAVMPGDEPFALAGSSFGGHLSLAIVRSIPDRIRGVALLVPDVPARDGSRDTAEQVTLVEDLSIFDDLAEDEQWIPKALVVHEERMLREIREHEIPAYRIADYDFLDRLNANYLVTGSAGQPGPPFSGPSLILTGRQDATVGYRSAWGLLDEFPRATFAVEDMAGHGFGRVERPELFAALVGDWLDRMRSSGQG